VISDKNKNKILLALGLAVISDKKNQEIVSVLDPAVIIDKTSENICFQHSNSRPHSDIRTSYVLLF
jgi:hypothetical protein